MSDDQAKEPEDCCEGERMEIKVVGHAAPLRYPPLETVVTCDTANAPETRKPPRGLVIRPNKSSTGRPSYRPTPELAP